GISTDASGSIYIIGRTLSATGIATSGAYQTSNAGNFDVFLAKFSSSGSRTWATYYGGSDDDEGYGVSIDGSGNVYVTGNARSTSGIATSGAYQTSYKGGFVLGDAFVSKFSNSGSLIWATYYGGSNDDLGNGICTDASGNIFISGYTSSSNGIATSGAYQTSYA